MRQFFPDLRFLHGRLAQFLTAIYGAFATWRVLLVPRSRGAGAPLLLEEPKTHSTHGLSKTPAARRSARTCLTPRNASPRFGAFRLTLDDERLSAAVARTNDAPDDAN